MDPTVTAWGTEYTAVNGSGQALPQTCSMETVVQASLTFIIALVGLAGNGIVLWILGFHMRRNAFTVYILNLAGADFLCLSLLIIRSLVLLSNFFRSSSISIPKFLTPVFTFVYIVGLSVLSAISTERCLSVLCPIWYRCRRPRHTSAVMCALLWALSLLLSVLRGEYCGFLFSDGDVGWCRVIDFISAAWLIFLFVLLSGSSLALPTRLLWGSQQVQLTRLYLTIVLTALVFLFCGLPLGIHWFLVFWIQGGFDMFSLHLYLVTMFLSCVNSSTNPVIYFFVGSFRRRQRQQQRRQTLKLVLQRALQDTPEVAESGGSLPQEPLEMSGSSVVS